MKIHQVTCITFLAALSIRHGIDRPGAKDQNVPSYLLRSKQP